MEEILLDRSLEPAESELEPEELREEEENGGELDGGFSWKRSRFDLRSLLTKKHLVLASLIAVLGVAVYLNWALSKGEGETPILETAVSSEGGSATYYGDVQQVDAAVSVYFEEARLNRSTARDQSLSKLEDLLANTDVSSEDKKLAVEQAAALAMNVSAENRIEELVLAKGFSACIAYIGDGTCSVVVQTDGLLAEEAAQIKDIILRECSGVTAQNISIVEVN